MLVLVSGLEVKVLVIRPKLYQEQGRGLRVIPSRGKCLIGEKMTVISLYLGTFDLLESPMTHFMMLISWARPYSPN